MDFAALFLFFFTGSGASPILADPVARRTFLVPPSGGILVPRQAPVIVV